MSSVDVPDGSSISARIDDGATTYLIGARMPPYLYVHATRTDRESYRRARPSLT